MTTGPAKVASDIEKYLWLCKRYGETPQMVIGARNIKFIDCYGPHAARLGKRLRKEVDK